MASPWWRKTTGDKARMLLDHSLRTHSHGVVYWAFDNGAQARVLLGEGATVALTDDVEGAETSMLLALAMGDSERAAECAETFAIDASVAGHPLEACEAVLRYMLAKGNCAAATVMETLGLADEAYSAVERSCDTRGDAEVGLELLGDSSCGEERTTRKRAMSLVPDFPKIRKEQKLPNTVPAPRPSGPSTAPRRPEQIVKRSDNSRRTVSGYVLETPPRPVKPPSLSSLGIGADSSSSHGSPRVSSLVL